MYVYACQSGDCKKYGDMQKKKKRSQLKTKTGFFFSKTHKFCHQKTNMDFKNKKI